MRCLHCQEPTPPESHWCDGDCQLAWDLAQRVKEPKPEDMPSFGALVEADATVKGDEIRYVPQPDPGQTHFEGCWADRRHYLCAMQEIVRLNMVIAKTYGGLWSLQQGHARPTWLAEICEELRIETCRQNAESATRSEDAAPPEEEGITG